MKESTTNYVRFAYPGCKDLSIEPITLIFMGLIGLPEMILIVAVAIFFFGPDKIPELARSLGKATGEFKRAQMASEQEIRKLNDPLDEKDTKIHNLAIEMGLDVNNKTSEQLVEEIRLKIRSKETKTVTNTAG